MEKTARKLNCITILASKAELTRLTVAKPFTKYNTKWKTKLSKLPK